MAQIPWLNPSEILFPSPALALNEPNGLLAVGGDLSPERILAAYHQGIFPWFNPGDPILWWSPSPRTVIYPTQLHVSKSLRKLIRSGTYRVSFDHCFSDVMRACAAPRSYADGTWISEDIIAGYSELHERGYAHSVEVWRKNDDQEELVGGLYGMALGRIFFGESMFSRADNASKVGLAFLVAQLQAWEFQLIDCQVANEHLFSLGAVEIPREEFQQLLINFVKVTPNYPPNWSKLTPENWPSLCPQNGNQNTERPT
ncbi:leucyl/phenylalanyl-tRNA--protein transferase [Cellvibrio zantedeschiae]|uniref:Leucyl/phenylalanyl-tRNA--protein transferase n=1 Tax=Cellvibrio zantedeschiae TaxID=1237077 RepID=A0ABQ3ASZ0_9GAMM|nr:leucyl/phenylalanyl-tRNA--protein transferase [Cellvibrio zantedeschiae]GGY66829.1 leucyl/phenylalanyl-tRNA--protein transferase [Cellvibrio zantedeschiae]